MGNLFRQLFDTAEFNPRWNCGQWTPLHGWVHIISDAAIFAAYAAIPAVLVFFALRRKDVPFLRIFWLFAAFILFCGLGHLVESTLFWHPWYRLSGLVKVLTATASWATVVALTRIVPQALALPGIAKANEELARENQERRRSEQALRESEELFRGAFENTNVAMVLTDVDNRFVRVNAAFAKMFGYAPHEILQMSLADLTHADDLAESLARRQDLLGGQSSFFEMEKRYLHKDGRVLWGLANISLVRDAEGNPLQYVGQVQDITERKLAEDALREGQNRMRLILDTANDPFIIADADGRITEWNTQAVATFGWPREEAIGRNLSDTIIPPQHRENHVRGMLHYLETGEGPILNRRIEIEALHREGRVFPVELTVWPTRIGKAYAFSAFVRDLTERKQAEERFRLVVEAAPNGMVMINREGLIVLVNAQTERLFGYSRDELLGQPVELLVPESFRSNHPGHRDGFFVNPQTRSMGAGRDLFGRRKNGGEFPIEIGLNPIEHQGELLVLSVIADITARKRAEEKFRLAVESSPNGMVLIDRDGRIVLVNSQTEKLFGYLRDELLGQMVELLVPDRFRGDHPDHRDGFFASPQARSMGVGRELFGRRKDGSEFPVEIGLNPIETDEGLLVLSAIVDITERKRTEAQQKQAVEEALRRSEERFHVLVDSVQDYSILMLDPEGRVATWNAGARRLKGYLAEEIIGRHFFCFYPPEDVAADKPERVLATAREQGRVEDEGWRIRKDGSRFWASVAVTPLWERSGKLRGYAKVTRDFTERKQSEDRVSQLNLELAARISELASVNRELESFCYSISHDLRAPLRAIDGFSRIVLKDFAPSLPAEAQRFLQDVRTNTLQMGRLIDDLLDFSRLSRHPLKKQDVAPARIVNECLKELQAELSTRSVEWRIGELPECQADPALLKQVWINLLSNALKYTGRRPAAVIEIGCTNGDRAETTAYFVKDNGVGFDMKYAGKLFGVFQRMHRAEDYAGTGVGLAIVQRIVHRHGGKIWAEARPDKGATFFFTLEGAAADERVSRRDPAR